MYVKGLRESMFVCMHTKVRMFEYSAIYVYVNRYDEKFGWVPIIPPHSSRRTVEYSPKKHNKKQRIRSRSQDKVGEKQKWKSSILWDGRTLCLSDHCFETLCLSFSLSHCNIYIWFHVLFSLSLFPHFILAYAALSFILLRLLLLSCSLTILVSSC